ncbi:putative sulfate exporter family transporter [uncultured Cohaesibacter sp.]|uniref:YeiH family protein n=1 Tax=uncultured Cohaesibacter sp. TaxID=1002546 RepID=UPI0029C7085D|nr:putative sulfate exporter family transporter [uncultured Cohaesibacter sp.]
MRIWQYIQSVLPGFLLCGLITILAYGAEWLEVQLTGHCFMDALVFSIILGTAVHSILGMNPVFRKGVNFSAKYLLELAIVLLGASVSLTIIQTLGPLLLLVVIIIVALAITASYTIGRLLGLPEKQAMLVACGNSICGNSAIVAIAPVIDADSEDIASAIAFSATLGIIVVLALPAFANSFAIDPHRFGIFAGMTVYAVPQVLAATAPVSTISVHFGTLVKLMRVLMLGPVILILGVRAGRKAEIEAEKSTGKSLRLNQLVPWFIIGFFLMIALQSVGAIPEAAMPPIKSATTLLTILSMAGLGLMVDVKSVFASSGRVLATGTLSILFLGALGASAIALLSL